MKNLKAVCGFIFALSVSSLFSFGQTQVNSSSQYRDFAMACRDGDLAKVERLFKPGMNVNAQDQFGTVPLVESAWSGKKDVCEFLISKGADLNAKNKEGRTPLLEAISYGQQEVAALLISKGANVNEKDNDGCTPLMEAAKHFGKETCELLLSKSADINAKNKYGRTALFCAVNDNNKWITELLLSKGADTRCKDIDGNTALEIAVRNGSKEICEMLRGKGAPVTDDQLQRMAMGEIKALASICLSYSTDTSYFPKPGKMNSLLPVTDLDKALAPDYIQKIPERDPWGGSYMYLVSDNGENFAIVSYGKDKAADSAGLEEKIREAFKTKRQVKYTDCYQSDIIWVNDAFLQHPEGEQKDCRK